MLKKTTIAIAATAAIALTPSVASADPAICHNGVLSDDAGQGCADGLYASTFGGGGGSSAICHDGILSNDVGQGCADGLYNRLFGSAGSTGSAGSSPVRSTSGGGSSNSMVNPNCESGGNPQVVSPDGQYWGLYQFDYATWVAHGGSPGSYGNAPASVQHQVASRVRYDAWPNC